MEAKKSPPTWSRWAAWLALGGVVVGLLAAIPTPGCSDVPHFWMGWMHALQTEGIAEGYAVSVPDCSPLSLVFLYGAGLVAEFTGVSEHLALKTGLAAFALTAAGLFAAWHRRPWLTAAFLAALILSSSAHAYLDVIYVPALLLSLHALSRDRLVAASAWFALAAAVKWQPLIVAPFFLVYALQRRPQNSSISAWKLVLLGALPVCLTFVLVFGPVPLARSLVKALTVHTGLSYQALNPGWLIQLALQPTHPGVPLYEIPAPPVATILLKTAFAAVYSLLLFSLWRRPRGFPDFMGYACAGMLAYYTLNTGVHENHLFLGLVLGFVYAAVSANRTAWLMAAWCGLMTNLNLLIFNGVSGVDTAFGGGTGFFAQLLCVANLVAIALCVGCCLRERHATA